MPTINNTNDLDDSHAGLSSTSSEVSWSWELDWLIFMAPRGRQADTGILKELTDALGPRASKPEMCRKLAEWFQKARKARNNKRANRIKRTQKALECRRHRGD